MTLLRHLAVVGELLADDDFQIRSEVDLDFVMFIRSAIATVAEVLLVVDLA
jgi:hypothetical protein